MTDRVLQRRWGYGAAQGFGVGFYVTLVVVAVIAVALLAWGRRSGERRQDASKSVARSVGVAAAIFVGFTVLVMVWFLVGTLLSDDDDSSGPSTQVMSAAVEDVVVFVGNPDEEWETVHPDIQSNTTRAEYLACVENTPGPIRPRGTVDDVTDDSMTWGSVTVAASDEYVRDGITHVDVVVQDGESGDETLLTVLIFREGGEPDGQQWVIGAIPEYPCLVGAETVRQQLLAE